jgi:hypothetical protein
VLRTYGVAILIAAVFAALGYALWAGQTGDAAGVLTNRRLIIPGIARDSQLQSSLQSSVVISFEMARNEPAVTAADLRRLPSRLRPAGLFRHLAQP